MRNMEEDTEWKTEAPYLACLQKENPFIVPEQYFNTLPEMIKSAIYTDQLKEVIPMSGFIVPDLYFNNLQDRILIETGEGLQNFPKTDGYTTPASYFEKLQSNILTKTTEADLPVKREPKIIRLWHNKLIKYASVACFILVTAFGLYLNQQSFNRETGAADMANEQMLYDMNEQDIIDHIEGNNVDIQKDNTDNTDMETYILNNYSQSELSSANN